MFQSSSSSIVKKQKMNLYYCVVLLEGAYWLEFEMMFCSVYFLLILGWINPSVHLDTNKIQKHLSIAVAQTHIVVFTLAKLVNILVAWQHNGTLWCFSQQSFQDYLRNKHESWLLSKKFLLTRFGHIKYLPGLEVAEFMYVAWI